jgi:hypothetical protein
MKTHNSDVPNHNMINTKLFIERNICSMFVVCLVWSDDVFVYCRKWTLSSVRYTKCSVPRYVYKWGQLHAVYSSSGRYVCRLPFPEQYPAPVPPHTRYHCRAHCFMVACDYCNNSGGITSPTSVVIHRRLLGHETEKSTYMPNIVIPAVVNCFSGIPQSQCLKMCRGQLLLHLSKFVIDNCTVFWVSTYVIR